MPYRWVGAVGSDERNVQREPALAAHAGAYRPPAGKIFWLRGGKNASPEPRPSQRAGYLQGSYRECIKAVVGVEMKHIAEIVPRAAPPFSAPSPALFLPCSGSYME